jgi:nucleotide-binding universal stress UspA family protein
MEDIKRIVAPIDFSDNTEMIASTAACIAGKFSADLDLIFVAESFEDYTAFRTPPANLLSLKEELLDSAKEQMNAFIKKHKEKFNALGVSTINGLVLSGDIAEKIINYAGEANEQIIVMGTHGYKGFNRLVFGSVAEKVVKTARCPVMTIKPSRQG